MLRTIKSSVSRLSTDIEYLFYVSETIQTGTFS